jgi:nucleoside-diphosphate-sugar epimerase
MRVLVSGANGFVGRALCSHLNAHGHAVVPAVRRDSGLAGEAVVGDIDGATDWTAALPGCDAVAHLAARVHMMDESAQDVLALYRATNTQATLSLAQQATQVGVKRLVFISSIKVNGDGSPVPYCETDFPAPHDPYATSKWEAEQGLHDIAARTGLEVVILRPPLVYGPGVKANFRRLIDAVRKGIPLPFGSIDNRRSLLYLGNLVDAIRVCIEHPVAANKTYLISDGEDVSTPDLVRRLAKAMNRPARLLPVPPTLLSAAGTLLGKRDQVARLLGSLTLDSSAIRRDLGWTPPYTLDDGLHMTVSEPA